MNRACPMTRQFAETEPARQRASPASPERRQHTERNGPPPQESSEAKRRSASERFAAAASQRLGCRLFLANGVCTKADCPSASMGRPEQCLSGLLIMGCLFSEPLPVVRCASRFGQRKSTTVPAVVGLRRDQASHTHCLKHCQLLAAKPLGILGPQP